MLIDSVFPYCFYTDSGSADAEDDDADEDLWESVEEFRGDLGDRLHVTVELLDFLEKQQLLNKKSKKTIMSQPNEKQKAHDLLGLLESRGNEGFHQLEKAMEASGQSGLVVSIGEEHLKASSLQEHKGEETSWY